MLLEVKLKMVVKLLKVNYMYEGENMKILKLEDKYILDPITNKKISREQYLKIKDLKNDINILKQLLKKYETTDLISLTFLQNELEEAENERQL